MKSLRNPKTVLVKRLHGHLADLESQNEIEMTLEIISIICYNSKMTIDVSLTHK